MVVGAGVGCPGCTTAGVVVVDVVSDVAVVVGVVVVGGGDVFGSET